MVGARRAGADRAPVERCRCSPSGSPTRIRICAAPPPKGSARLGDKSPTPAARSRRRQRCVGPMVRAAMAFALQKLGRNYLAAADRVPRRRARVAAGAGLPARARAAGRAGADRPASRTRRRRSAPASPRCSARSATLDCTALLEPLTKDRDRGVADGGRAVERIKMRQSTRRRLTDDAARVILPRAFYARPTLEVARRPDRQGARARARRPASPPA